MIGARSWRWSTSTPSSTWRRFERYGAATISQVVPTMFVRLLKLPKEVRERYDVSSMRSIIHAAAPCPVPVKQEIIEWFGPILHEYYAGTEGNGFVLLQQRDVARPPGHRGDTDQLASCTSADDDGVELPRGEPGTVYFEGGATFEYHNDADKTKASRHRRGMEHARRCRLPRRGQLLVPHRPQGLHGDLGGVNLYPQETENVLITHPAVIDVAVFGVPNDEFGEELKAVVQPATMPATARSAQSLSAQLIAYCRSQLADVKCPRSVDFREELPRHPTGKLYKRLLKDEYWKAATARSAPDQRLRSDPTVLPPHAPRRR
jgi:acyl-CoA synthetase (AMP-forming)/AMP-acid ligase II